MEIELFCIAFALLRRTPNPVLYSCADNVCVEEITAINAHRMAIFFMVIYFAVDKTKNDANKV
jgi:hypothetical protein